MDYARDRLSPEEFDYCCRHSPYTALANHSNYLSLEQIAFCLEDDPTTALYACESSPHLLTDVQMKYCCVKAPAGGLRYASSKMDDSLFKECARKDPVAALRYCLKRLTDDEIMLYTAGFASEIDHLFKDTPDPLVMLRLAALIGRLDSAVEAVVIRVTPRQYKVDFDSDKPA